MKLGLQVTLTVLIVAGSWNGAAAQSSKAAKAQKAEKAVETASLTVPVSDSLAASDSTLPDTTHHKKGLFGKAKSVMKNKVVQQVVKTAACTMVPGGQAIAGAIDAASSKSAGEAAAGLGGAASGSSCMPGMGGMGGGAGMAAGAGLAGGLGGAGVAGLAGGGMPSTGMPTTGMPGMAAYGMGGDPKAMADCMGLTVEEYGAMTNPTSSQPRAMTKQEMKRSQQLSKKVGSQRQMMCSQQVGMQQATAQMAAVQQMMAQAQGGMAMPGASPASEAPGGSIELSPDLPAELKKGKTAVRGIDWMVGSADVSPAGKPGFDAAMATLAQAIKESGQRYRLDLYGLDGSDVTGPARLQVVQTALAGLIGDGAAVTIGKTKHDKNPRLEVVKAK